MVFFLYFCIRDTWKKNPSLSTATQRLETDAPNRFLNVTSPAPKQQTDTDHATVSTTAARVTVHPLESHHHSIYTTRYVLYCVSVR